MDNKLVLKKLLVLTFSWGSSTLIKDYSLYKSKIGITRKL